MDATVLRPAFDRLDRSHTGFINLQDVTFATGVTANKEESAVILAHFDQDGTGQVRHSKIDRFKVDPSVSAGLPSYAVGYVHGCRYFDLTAVLPKAQI